MMLLFPFSDIYKEKIGNQELIGLKTLDKKFQARLINSRVATRESTIGPLTKLFFLLQINWMEKEEWFQFLNRRSESKVAGDKIAICNDKAWDLSYRDLC